MVIGWLTGYDAAGLKGQRVAQAPAFQPNASRITGVICGCRVQDIVDPVAQKVRYLDKLVDELAQGRPLEKILRA